MWRMRGLSDGRPEKIWKVWSQFREVRKTKSDDGEEGRSESELFVAIINSSRALRASNLEDDAL